MKIFFYLPAVLSLSSLHASPNFIDACKNELQSCKATDTMSAHKCLEGKEKEG